MFSRIKAYFRALGSIFTVTKGLITGMWKLSKLPQPAITFFGGSKLKKDHPSVKITSELASKLAHEGFSIITGGGPGIMEAANAGAREHLKNHTNGKKIKTIGIGVRKLQSFNEYVQGQIIQPYFFTRKWLLVRYSVGFIVGPGGFGTLDELSEVLTLIQTHRMPRTPIVLIGKKYWQPILDWTYNCALKENLLSEEDASLLHVVDTANEALAIVKKQCSYSSKCGIEAKSKEKKTAVKL